MYHSLFILSRVKYFFVSFLPFFAENFVKHFVISYKIYAWNFFDNGV